MRLHQLELTAFGPFSETVAVDFDGLSEAGLFLLTGATGSGKTSILDAVCFALYGEVPGDRQGAKRLRSDQAAPGLRPEVTLELTLSGRRFRIVRSPAWERPKKRGSGTTSEPAAVRLSERVADGWRPLSSRLDETGHQITDLLGMNASQFCQVVMLPQGRFSSFLRARSEERHRLLQRLFRTARFEDVERWLGDRRRTLRTTSARHGERVAGLVNRISEAADAPVPEGWTLHDLSVPASEGAVAGWATDRCREAEGVARIGAARVAVAEADLAGSADTLAGATRIADLQRAHGVAADQAHRLRAASEEQKARRRRLASARDALAVVPLQALAAEQGEVADQAAQRARHLVGSARQLTDEAAAADLDLAARDAATAAAAARLAIPREHAAAELRAVLARDEAALADLTAERARLVAELAALPTVRQRVCTEHDAAVQATERVTGAQGAAVDLHRRSEAASRATSLERELAEAREELRAAVDRAQELKETWLELHEARIAGMAAELARDLAVGHDCPVCGSADHPHPAAFREGAPDAAADKAARVHVDDAEAVRHAHDGRVRDLTTQISALREAAGGEADALESDARAAQQEVRRLQALADTLPRRAAELRDVEATEATLTGRSAALAVEIASREATVRATRSEAEVIQRELDGLLAGSGCDSLEALVARHDQVAGACRRAVRAEEEAEASRRRATDLTRRAADAAIAAGFPDLETAVRAALDESQQAELESLVRDHDAALAHAEAQLADPELWAAAAVAAPDLDRLQEEHRSADAELARAREEATLAARRTSRLRGLTGDLETALAAWSPVRSDLALVTGLAALVEGTSPDNRLRMRLSGYVLAARLGQVVASANERLALMSDRRYSLEHTGARGVGENRGGLSLLVRDDWSGEARDPATLSGGETFVVSLALALGLADVITHEIGGADLDTLFVDEGFGSLDAETLDDVMDTLDGLREGGRVVGVVSHVAQMRERILTQLEVDKGRGGSTVRLRRHG